MRESPSPPETELGRERKAPLGKPLLLLCRVGSYDGDPGGSAEYTYISLHAGLLIYRPISLSCPGTGMVCRPLCARAASGW